MTSDLITVPFQKIPYIPTRWLAPGFIPLRAPVLLVAPGGTGKGMSIAAMAGIVTNGLPWPGEPEDTTREPGSVVIVAPEDDPNEDMRPRLEAAGASLDYVQNLTVLPDGAVFTLPEHAGVLSEAIRKINDDPELPDVKLVALDPLYAIVDKPARVVGGARQTWEDLTTIARAHNTGMVVSHHTTKNGRVVAGGSQLTAAARIVYLIGRADDDAAARVISVYKANKIPDDTQIRYRISGDGDDAHATFIRPDDANADPGSRTARLRLNEASEPMPDLENDAAQRRLSMLRGA